MDKQKQLDKALAGIVRASLPEAVKVLLENGANANTWTEDALGYKQLTVLMFAAGYYKRDNADIVKMLLDYNAKIDEVSWEGWTALMLAVRNGNINTVDVLLRNGASVNLKKKDGHTALTLAVLNFKNSDCNTELIELLCQHGADINSISNDGSALEIAMKNVRGANEEKQSWELLIELLIDKGAYLPYNSETGINLLMFSAMNGLDKIVSLLDGTYINRDAKDRQGRTAGAMAKYNGYNKIAMQLA